MGRQCKEVSGGLPTFISPWIDGKKAVDVMNAYERHVIHAALQDMSGVTTYSIGTEPNRRVVVAFDRGERK